MKIKIERIEHVQEYTLAYDDATLLEALEFIKTHEDATLSYSSGCRSSVCGSCAVRVNDKEVLACSYKLQDGDVISPLKNAEVIRDLVVDMDRAYSTNARAKAWLSLFNQDATLNHDDEKINELQSDCILCGSCFSACPVLSVNGEFLGPFALTRTWKYVSDKREGDSKGKIDTVQNNGVWDCTLCNECTMVCPQGISSKADIEKLRMRSTMAGYSDPAFSQSFGGFGSFDGSPQF